MGLQNKSPYSVQMLGNKDQKNSEHVKFARGVKVGDSYFELLNYQEYCSFSQCFIDVYSFLAVLQKVFFDRFWCVFNLTG